MSLLKRIFPMFLNIMIAHYIKKSLVEDNILFDFILCDVRIYLFENNICKIILLKKNYALNILFK
jgi:hypothetical protein